MGDVVLVTGSTAIDHTGFYDGSFEDYEEQYPVTAFNASFQLGGMRTSFGGCAPNIAYGLNLLGIKGIPLSSAGRNFRDHYEAHLTSNGIDTRFIFIDDDVAYCASCLMINDEEGNQVIGFYPGPHDPKRQLPSELPIINEVRLANLGPEEPHLTLKQARDLAALGIPMVADPGQVTASFSRKDIRELLELVDALIVNEHELDVLLSNGGLDQQALMAKVPELVVTHSEQGVDVYRDGACTHVSAVPDVEIVEVTGCGDAFRAGYIYGMLNNLGIRERAEIGCVMAAINLACEETQRYRTSIDEVLQTQERVYRIRPEVS
ncbi:MAG: carbohydrate kinase family protein [Pseudomonadales bacterium]|jgi:adenosine kinase|nr:carbohydrate kinase family protein [Pseudomonadales bacterium]